MLEKLKANKALQLFILSLVCKIIALVCYHPVELEDTDWYRKAGESIAHFQWTWYNGARVPVYPFVFLLCHFNDFAIFLFQLCLGICIAMMLFYFFREISNNESIGFLAGLVYTLSPNQFLFEVCLVTETTTTFLIVLSFFVLTKVFRNPKKSYLLLLVAVTSCLTALTRPLFLFSPILILLGIVGAGVKGGWSHKKITTLSRAVIIFFVTILAFIGTDILLNKTQNNYTGVTTLAGFNLVNHVTSFVESASPKYDALKHILVVQREEQVRKTGKPEFAIYFVYRRMMKTTGTNFEEISKLLQGMAISAIENNPLAYAKSVLKGMLDFWKPAFQYHDFTWNPIVKSFLYVVAVIISIFYAVFIISPFLLFFKIDIGKRLNWGNEVVIIYAFTIIGWIVSSMMDLGENARYKVPFEPLILGIAIIQARQIVVNYLYQKRSK
jgi:4-amino-4-deoxy-L-arabinose transferase-like glycosyltransferase